MTELVLTLCLLAGIHQVHYAYTPQALLFTVVVGFLLGLKIGKTNYD